MPLDVGQRHAEVDAFDFRRVHPSLRFGTASDRYAGWLGQVYPRETWESRQGSEATRHRNALNKWYGSERGQSVKFAEAFEICEYGRQPSDAEIRQLFPFFEPTQ